MSILALRALAVCALVGGTVAPASAASISFGPASDSSAGPTIAFDGIVVPKTIVGDAIFTFTVQGDLNGSSEFVAIDIDGFSLGLVFNEDPSDDLFDFAGDEGGNFSFQTGSATILNADFAGLIGDGLLDLTFDFSPDVNNAGSIRSLEGSIAFTEGNLNAVPLPASLPLFALGLGGLLALRRRTNT
ncbi:MAG: VPLPA-CTERM sorting domain-containing protein [Pseudomonadota bacterium]